MRNFALFTPIIIPNLGQQNSENQGFGLNVLTAIPLVKSIWKGLKSQPKLSGGLQPPDNYANSGSAVTERKTHTAYLLVELLDDKNNVINTEYRKVLVSSQGEWQELKIDEEVVNLGEECRQSGFIRLSVVNDTDYNIWFDDFEITHKESSEKINVKFLDRLLSLW